MSSLCSKEQTKLRTTVFSPLYLCLHSREVIVQLLTLQLGREELRRPEEDNVSLSYLLLPLARMGFIHPITTGHC